MEITSDEIIQLFKGNFQKIPKRIASEIKIFLSSTFKDLNAERDYLIRYYNSFRTEFFKKYKKDLILIDMRCGITDEIENQNLTTKVCLSVIEQCKQDSLGPAFVAIIGDRYGTKFLKTEILEDEFKLIKVKMIDKEMIELLEKCYEFDDNSIDNKTYNLKYFNDILNTLKINKNDWKKKKDDLRNSICNAVNKCFEENLIDSEKRNSYLISVTACEIEAGIVKNKDANEKAFSIIRVLKNNQNKSLVEDDEISKELLNELKSRVMRNPFFTIEVDTPNLVDSLDEKETKNYFERFKEIFIHNIEDIIDKNIKKYESHAFSINEREKSFYDEVVHHARYCAHLRDSFDYKVNSIEKVEEYLKDKTNLKPFIITGPAGSGKTTLIAKLSKKIYDEKLCSTLIIRFMGTSRRSSTSACVLKSIIDQLNFIYKIHNNDKKFAKKYSLHYTNSVTKLRDKLYAKLEDITEDHPNETITILLDSIELLKENNHNLDWILYNLPNHRVKFIYTVRNNYKNLFEKLEEKLEGNYLAIEKLDYNIASRLLSNLLETKNRQLTEQQWDKINLMLVNTHDPYPLYLKLLFDITSSWRSSYSVPDEFTIKLTIKDIIKYLFEKLEKLYGEKLFKHCVFYLTLFGARGISESELEDILSIDDDVLTEVFNHHQPPVRRFPIALWLNIKFQIQNYITNKEIDDIPVISWFHSQFYDASIEHYHDMFEKSKSRDDLLMNVIEYFTEEWNEVKSNGEKGQQKSFKFDYKNKKLTHFDQDGQFYSAYRNTKPQKIIHDDHKIIYNKRKLNEFINIVMMLNNTEKQIDLLKKHVYFNYEFIYSKAKLCELDFVIDMHPKISNLNDQELIEISRIYCENFPCIEHNPENLYLIVLRRFYKRTAYLDKFLLSSKLDLVNKIKTYDSVKGIFCTDGEDLIIQYFLMHKHNFIMIQTKPKLKKRESNLHLLNLNTMQRLGKIYLKSQTENILIYIEDDFNKLNLISDLNGYVYYIDGRVLYISNFDNEDFSFEDFDNEKLKDFLIVDKNTLVLIFDRKILLVKHDTRGNLLTLQKIENQIKFIEANISKDTIFTSSLLNSASSAITVLVCLESNIIKVYRYSRGTENILDLQYTISDFSFVDSIKFDESCFIGYCNNLEMVTQFAIVDKGNVLVIQANKDKFEIIERILKQKLDILSANKVEIISLFKNKIIISSENCCLMKNIYIHNLESKKGLQLSKLALQIDYIQKYDLLALTCLDCLRLIDCGNLASEDEIASYRIRFINKKTLKAKNGSILGIERIEETYMSYGTTLQEIDLKSNIITKNMSQLYINRILCHIDTKHALVEKMRNGKHSYAIVDVGSEKVVEELNEIEKIHQIKFLGVFKKCLLFCYVDKNDIYDTLLAYKIDASNEEFKFVELYRRKVNNDSLISDNNAYFTDSIENELIIARYRAFSDSLNLLLISDDGSVTTTSLQLKKVELNREKMTSLIINTPDSLIQSLILWEESQKIIYHAKLPFKNKQRTNELETEHEVWKLLNISETEYLVLQEGEIKQQSSLYLVKINEDEDKLERTLLDEVNGIVSNFKLENGYLIVNVTESIFLYEIGGLLNKEYNEPIEISNRIIDDDTCEMNCCISSDGNYFGFFTTDYKLCVYKLSTKTLIASLQLGIMIGKLFMSERFISGKLDGKFLTFEIFDN